MVTWDSFKRFDPILSNINNNIFDSLGFVVKVTKQRQQWLQNWYQFHWACFCPWFSTSSSCGTSDQDLSSICSSTQNEEHCKQLLLSDPRTKYSDPPLISIISIELALKQARYNLREFTGYRNNSTDPNLWKSFGDCTVKYKAVVDDLDKAFGLSKRGDYKWVLKEGTPMKSVYDCENHLPLSSPTMAITEDMLLALETMFGVASYVVYKTS